MNIKTTKEIKRGNDYAGKRWVELSDLDRALYNIKREIELIEQEIEQSDLKSVKEHLNGEFKNGK